MIPARPMSPKRPQPPRRLFFKPHDAHDAHAPPGPPPPPYDPPSTAMATSTSRKTLEAVFENASSTPVTTLLGSSVVATAQMLGIDLPTSAQFPLIQDEQAIQQKSKEELFDLLRNAETVIRTHETELNLAALAGEALLRENSRLRHRHDSLAARVKPVVSAESLRTAFSRSRANSFERHLVPSAPVTPGIEILPVTPPRQHKHTRRLSASPEAVAALNNHNEELHVRLEKIINDAHQADQDGNRKLRQLQKEIEGLRSELESSQKRNLELEQEAEEGRLVGADHIRKEREEREAKLWAMRGKTKAKEAIDQVKDFAPGSFVPSSSTRGSISSMGSAHSSDSLQMPFPSRPFSSELETIAGEDEGDMFLARKSRERAASCTDEEYTILSQILSKIKELETTNHTISEQHREMNSKLELARQEADEMRSMYDALQVEEVEVDGTDEDGVPGTVRFFSVRSSSSSFRSALKRIASDGESDSASGSPIKLPDSPTPGQGGTGTNPSIILSRPRKTRATIDSLFPFSSSDQDSATSPTRSEDSERTAHPPDFAPPPTPPPTEVSSTRGSLRGSVRAHLSSRSAQTARDLESVNDYFSPRRQPSFFGMSVASTFPSFTSWMGSQQRARTLGSELGSEFGDEWLTGEQNTAFHETAEDESFSRSRASTINTATGDAEHPAMAALRRALDPVAAGRLLQADEFILPVASLNGAPGEAFGLIARAVAARPQPWVPTHAGTGVIGPCALRDATPSREDPWETTRYPEEAASPAARRRRASAFGRISAAVGRRLSSASLSSPAPPADEFVLVTPGDAAAYRRPPVLVRLICGVQARGEAVLAEVWLVVQFVIVIASFVFMMVRRGPRAVMSSVGARSPERRFIE